MPSCTGISQPPVSGNVQQQATANTPLFTSVVALFQKLIRSTGKNIESERMRAKFDRIRRKTGVVFFETCGHPLIEKADVWQKARNQTNCRFWTRSSDRSCCAPRLAQILHKHPTTQLDHGRLRTTFGSLKTRFSWHRTYHDMSYDVGNL